VNNAPTIPVDIIKWKITQNEKRGNHRDDPSIYYVTDLEKCATKRWFETHLTDLKNITVLNGRTLFGDIVHVGILTILKEIYGDRIKTELEDEKAVSGEKTIFSEKRKITIVGRIDAILDKTIGIEIKSSVSDLDSTLPVPWHITQARTYNWLFNLQKTRLIYVSPYGIFQYEIDTQITEDEIINIIKREKSPKWVWECKSCEFASICPIYRLKAKKENGENNSGEKRN